MNISTNEYNILNLPTTPDNSRLSLFSSWSGPYDKLGQSVTSSITSWSDGFEGETTKRLGQHIEHVQNSLYEPQEHFSHSKNLNLSEWKIFPHLRVIGVGIDTGNLKLDWTDQVEEVLLEHDQCQDIKNDVSEKEQEILKENIKNAVINQIFYKIWPDLVKKIKPIFKELSKNQDVDINFESKRFQRSISSNRNLTQVFPVKPANNNCNLPAQCSISKTSERHLSPISKTFTRKKQNAFNDNFKDKVKLTALENETRSSLSKKIPLSQWSRHLTLPPIECTEAIQNKVNNKYN
uniref:Uncharacterized protein n=1 Tax=Clastoptera arizonana TaxID=38151 RepID=A0A1B6D4M1_9HEMI